MFRPPQLYRNSRRLFTKAGPRRNRYRILTVSAIVSGGVVGVSALIWGSQPSRERGTGLPSRLHQPSPSAELLHTAKSSRTTWEKPLSILNTADAERFLSASEQTYMFERQGNPVQRYDINSLASNSPAEDDFAAALYTLRSPTAQDLFLFAVFDGHSGWQASRYLAETLTSRIAEETTGLIQQHLESSRRDPSQLDHSIHSTIKSIFTSIDEEMITLPLTIMSDYETVGPSPRSAFQRLVDLQALLRAVSGSCALVACLDAGRNRLHIAVTGDSRAVMGAWHVSPDGKGGSWKTQVLTEDQTGFNPAELARLRSEHPASENETVVINGRTIGGLGVTRAFGDARFKWPADVIGRVFHTIRGEKKQPYKHYETPPYVTAVPEVVSVPVQARSPSPGPSKRFFVLATDGLFDKLTNDEVVGLVGGWLDGQRGTYPRSHVLSHVSSADPSVPAHQPQPRRDPSDDSDFVFQDDNVATHLIRNALGGSNTDQVRTLLSIRAPYARFQRDDITAIVVLL